MAMDLETSQQLQRPPTRRPSARHRRAMSAIARPNTASLRPGTASGRPRRPYSAYTKRGGEETTPKYDAPETNREWWRYCVKVCILKIMDNIAGENKIMYSVF